MKKLDYTPITNSSQFFPKKGTLAFLQLAYQEGFTELIKALIGSSYNPGTVYILRGMISTGVLPTYTTTEGVVFYGGEFFIIDAANFSASGSNVGVFSIVQTQYVTDADPCVFSDATSHNIHNIRKMQLVQGASGSGLANFAQASRLSFIIPAQVNITASGQAVKSGVYPNINIDVPNSTNLNPVLFAGSYNIGDVGGAPVDYSVTFASVGSANYYIQGTIVSNGAHQQDVKVSWCISNRTATGFTLTVGEWSSTVQDIAFEFILFAK